MHAFYNDLLFPFHRIYCMEAVTIGILHGVKEKSAVEWRIRALGELLISHHKLL